MLDQPGYESVSSQLAAAVSGCNVFCYITNGGGSGGTALESTSQKTLGFQRLLRVHFKQVLRRLSELAAFIRAWDKLWTAVGSNVHLGRGEGLYLSEKKAGGSDANSHALVQARKAQARKSTS